MADPHLARPLLVGDKRNDRETAREAAISIAKQIPAAFGLARNALLYEVSTRKVANVWHSAFRLSYDGIPVRDCGLHTMIGSITGSLMTVMSDVPIALPNGSTPQIAAGYILAKIPSFLNEDKLNPIISITPPSLIYFHVRYAGKLRLAYELMARQGSPSHAWRLTVDAMTAQLLEKKDMLEYIGDTTTHAISGKLLANIHPQSPFDSSVTVGFPYTRIVVDGKLIVTDSAGNWSADVGSATPPFISIFADAYHHVERHDAPNDTLRLTNLAAPYRAIWNDSNSHAAERDAYYAAGYARRYALKLDTALSAIDAPFIVNVNLNETCNAFYDADSISLNFFKAGNNCSNSGEIADVVYHEFGHRVAHVRYENGANGNLINYTLGEGFADLISAFMRDDPRIGIGFFADDSSKVLRNCDNTKSFPHDINADPHISGEIVSGALWDLRKLIGLGTDERLFHEMEWLNPDGPDETSPDILQSVFLQTLVDVLTVDDDDNDLTNGTPHSSQILEAFSKHGITLASLITLVPQKIGDQDSAVNNYPVTVRANYNGPIGILDPAKLLLYYSIDHGQHSTALPFTVIGDSIYQAIIPNVSAGTIVSYYVSASLDLDHGGTKFTPLPFEPLFFTIGYHSVYYDDCETDRGWSLREPSDKAVKGLWVRDVPFGTYNVPDHFVQQDTDHTPNGTMCYVTGNLHDAEVGADDVDSGTTTLTTNAIDLSEVTSPVLRYWYYYSNDQADNPTIPVWITEISGDDGQTWKNVQYTNESTDGWTSYLLRVSDYVTPSSKVRLRFTASDYIAAVVEAGVDDLEALSAPGSSLSAVPTSSEATFGIESIYPNPSTSSGATIDFRVPERSHVTLIVKNVLGEIVATLADQLLIPGSYNLQLVPALYHLTSSIYWVVLSTSDRQSIRKMVLSE